VRFSFAFSLSLHIHGAVIFRSPWTIKHYWSWSWSWSWKILDPGKTESSCSYLPLWRCLGMHDAADYRDLLDSTQQSTMLSSALVQTIGLCHGDSCSDTRSLPSLMCQ
jgi:hypothetical protein